MKHTTPAELIAALQRLPKDAEIMIPTREVLYTVTGFEESFFSHPDKKFLKLKCDITDATFIDLGELKALREEHLASIKKLSAIDDVLQGRAR